MRGPEKDSNSLVCIVVFILQTTNHERDQFFKLGKPSYKASPSSSRLVLLVYFYEEGKFKNILLALSNNLYCL